MRTILAACVALSALAMPAMAQVTITTGPAPYWRGHEDNWRAREAFKEDQYQKQAWLEDHCVRDWSGHAFCRR